MPLVPFEPPIDQPCPPQHQHPPVDPHGLLPRNGVAQQLPLEEVLTAFDRRWLREELHYLLWRDWVRQALSALLFLYRDVLRQPLDRHVDAIRTRKPKR